MDHGNMGHGGMDHGGMDHGNMCNMNMLFTWDTNNLCIVFKSWRITSTMSLIWSLVGVMLLTAGYELVREMSRRYEAKVQREIDDMPRRNAADAYAKSKTIKAALYAIQVFYSFFIMLLFMTYNGWIMLSVAVGAFVGYLVFGNSTVTKSAACH
ncbi:Ctr copper transporter [Aureobasidium melanogenum CBS 110374]|uniref:Copper transport protein n=1 Tax=Aureobasidium melanogenum (strain CBS 110374) TaxID=1043003 RepID=A0A074VSI9_AURM1|nr:Ctr copper transporter [Aureobasidium melanogenum CBS 110374]KEQ62199.1 Ctr copper transporter [Aureobasidium melanogenum CBS 110374]